MVANKQFHHSYSKRAVSFIIIAVLAVCIVALAASTKPAEYQSVARFETAEETVATAKALLPHSAALFVAHAEGMGLSSTKQLADDTPMTPSEIEDKAAEWVDSKPHEVHRVMLFIWIGGFMVLGGIVLLIYSEFCTVMVVRALDANIMEGLPRPSELEEQEMKWGKGMKSTLRPYLSLGGVFLMFVGICVTVSPLCSVIADWGLPEAQNPVDCYTIVFLSSIVQVTFLSTLAVALVWSCTRPYAAVLLGSISLGAFVGLSIADPIFILFWCFISGFLAAYYLSIVPESQDGYVPDMSTPLKQHAGGVMPPSGRGRTAMV
mmetsp:Transcript_27444/g.56241  ORF Transcript_27444/g.56241 Transcript_27444/m.56241 type:complete len:320 (-) Transcript_27444:254-1213(-)|eukprot:CAMPEP_0181312338 /NCGR_PEP_ID=MMETSP1101-20121128/13642_1 /TAXON_ID=46948 /ORGANISM="Rhodomonas abbreviata, Strain Caron Lab Isolate" /LENGTH=319 /DNA_ID=CAMNT_0023419179 /DNA_START=151 /DNA_END=1110 /DNA_ORIENTATION=-